MTPKQQRFVDEYLVDLNATQAAIRAGYSERTAEEQGYQLLRKTSVAEAIAERQAERAERTETTQDQVIADLKRLARAAEKDRSFAPAIRAHELIGKHLGMFSDKVQLTGGDGKDLSLTVTYVKPK